MTTKTDKIIGWAFGLTITILALVLLVALTVAAFAG